MNKAIELRAGLAKQKLFATSDAKTIELLANAARVVDFKSGAYVTIQGEVDSPLLLILSGQLRVSTLSAKGDEAPIRIVSAGESTGAVPIISNRPSDVNVIANRESTIAMIGRTLARQVLCEPRVSVALNRLLASLVGRLIHCHGRREFPRADARVAAVIVDELDLAADLDAAPAEPLGQATIAAMAKVSRETVSRVLSSLELRGLIAKEGRRIRVLDPNALRALVEGM